MNSKIKGNIGIGKAISYYTSLGNIVSLPINDSQDYDLIIDDGKLNRIQVKYTDFLTHHNIYKVDLRTNGGNKSRNTHKPFNNTTIEYLLCVTSKNDIFIIPSKKIPNKNSINLGEKYNIYKK